MVIINKMCRTPGLMNNNHNNEASIGENLSEKQPHRGLTNSVHNHGAIKTKE